MNGAFFAIIPLLFYLALIGFTIWFCTSLITAQKERNQILREISSKLDGTNIGKKEE
ncbi:hypothetical protein [Cytobacillus solani]|uniref:hypothetical protein n=1 Tax=Cytobacillus solani TaxID=1637975 RepID=UPI000AC1DEAB|nr:hypothetical protein [Cytobacillus solani]